MMTVLQRPKPTLVANDNIVNLHNLQISELNTALEWEVLIEHISPNHGISHNDCDDSVTEDLHSVITE